MADRSVLDSKNWVKVSKSGITERKRTKIRNLIAHLHTNKNSHIQFQENTSDGLGGVAISNFFF